ncbi:MAG: hypothetical protein AAFQ82_16830 [Myxococcota bacterium]
MARPISSVVFLGALFGLCGEAFASVDVAELYIRKIREGERTFFQDGGWRGQRNRVDFFYEADYILGAGTGDPRFVLPASDEEDPLGSASLGALLLLTPPKSLYELSVYYLTNRTFQVDGGDDAFALLPLLAPFAPRAFAVDNGLRVNQQLSGFQFRFEDWMEASVGLLTDQRQGEEVSRAFFEFRSPLTGLDGDIIPDPNGGTERLRLGLYYTQSEYFSSVQAGYFSREINEKREFVYAEVEQLLDWVSAGARITTDGDLASVFGGVEISTYDNDDPRKGGKFGQAYNLVLQLQAVDPALENLWSSSFGESELLTGYKLEVYFQQPLLVWLGVFQMMLTASAAALEENETRRNEMIERGVEAASATFDAAEAVSII